MPATWDAALAPSGRRSQAVDAVLDGDAPLAYALVRPPGPPRRSPRAADGYCFFSNIALAAEHARRRGVERVAIVDWDVHHGNGTQACFYDRADVLTISLHKRARLLGRRATRRPARRTSWARGAGEGLNVNVELPLGTGDVGYREAMERVVAPIVRRVRARPR